jgi:hypothetical protein
MPTVSAPIRISAATMCLLCALSQLTYGGSIGVNFATDGTGADFDLAPVDETGVVPQQHWNNANNSDPTLSNLLDDQGNGTGASITWTHSPVSTNVPGGTPAGDLLHSAVLCSPADGIVVSNVPYSTFDLYLYVAAPGTQPPLAEFKINHANSAPEQISVIGLADISGSTTFALSSLSNMGNYLYLGGVSGSTLYIGGSGFPPVDGLQIVETPEPGSVALLISAVACWAGFRSRHFLRSRERAVVTS